MKKVILVFAAMTIFALAAHAQGVKFGVTAGLNGSSMRGEDDGGVKYKLGFQAGVVADISVNEIISVVPELLFTQKGAKETITMTGADATVTLNLNYLQLPINATFKFNAGPGKFLAFAGPYVAYGVLAKSKAKSSDSGITVTVETDEVKFGSKEGEVKPFDYGVNMGIGYELNKYFVKAQYTYGLGNMSNYSGSEFKSYNYNFALTLGYYFH